MTNAHPTTPKNHPWTGISLLTVGFTAVGLLIGQTAGAHIAYPYEVEHRTAQQYYQVPPRPAVLSAEVEEVKLEEPAGPTVDPQELQSVRKQMSDLLSDIKRLKGLAKKNKLTDVLEELNAIEAKLRELQARLRTVPQDEARDVLEEFYQERYHEQLNPLQQKVELPGEIKNVIKQINDLRREVKNLRKQAKVNKVGGVEEELNALDAKLADVPAKLNATPLDEVREVLEEFYQANHWEQLNPLRAKIELPRELKEIERRLREAEKLLKTKSVQKALEGLGVKIEAVRNKLSEMQAAYEAVKNQLASGDFEDLEETLRPIRETHPGMITGMLHGVREAWSGIRRVKDQEVRDALLRFLAPAVNAINEGDYEELNFIQQEIGPEFDRLLEKALRANLRGRNRSDLLERLDKLDALIEGKLGEREEREAREVPEAKPEMIAPMPVPVPMPVPMEKPVPEATPMPTPEATPPPPLPPSEPSPAPTPAPTVPEGGAG